MNSVYSYIVRASYMEQIRVLLIVVVSLPFYYLSLGLPKYIISDALQGRAFPSGQDTVLFAHLSLGRPFASGEPVVLFGGVELDRLSYLFTLSSLFLLLVLINSGFKHWINLRKGALGERLLQRLRFDLFSAMLAMPPDMAQKLKPAEAATVIKDEVEQIGGFAGDAFVLPVFLIGQALTAVLFILAQNLALGLIAVAVVAIQAAVVPRIRREQVRLGRERQIASRGLAGKIGEVVETMGEVANHGTAAVERGLIARRLEELFGIRYRLYSHKFAAKTLNNLLAQIPPFLFYTVGGYAALTGKLEIGQLVAVVTAYRDLPPPVKELLDWDQQRIDVEAKFLQITEQFALLPPVEAPALPEPDNPVPATRAIAQGLSVVAPTGEPLLDRVSLVLPLGGHVALTGTGEGASSFAKILAGRIAPSAGSLTIEPPDASAFSPAARGRRIAYVGAEPAIFDASLRDNILYSLRQPDRNALSMPQGWSIDPQRAGAADFAVLNRRLIAVLHIVGLAEAVYRFGLARRIEAGEAPEIVALISQIRRMVRDRLIGSGIGDVIEPFDPAAYIQNASIGENILFGAFHKTPIGLAALMRDPLVNHVLHRTELAGELARIGRRIAATMIEIFADLPAEHPLFDRFSFVEASAFPAYRERLSRAEAAQENAEDQCCFMGLALAYIEPRHRLRLIDETLRQRLLAARALLHETAIRQRMDHISFYDAEGYCRALPLRENLLFGAVALDAPRARERADDAIRGSLADLGLEEELYGLGLEQRAGHGGRLLFPVVRMQISLARSLIKRPELLILDNALDGFARAEAAAIRARLSVAMTGASLVVVGREIEAGPPFDLVATFEGPRLVARAEGPAVDRTMPPSTPGRIEEDEDVKLLQAVPLFARLDTARIKLIAFTAERVVFEEGNVVFSQGEISDAAYLIVSGSAQVLISGAKRVLEMGSLFGELGVLTGDVRSATIVAATRITVLRLEKEVFLALLAEFPDMALSITTLVVRRLQDTFAS